jgi:hypothetical protein
MMKWKSVYQSIASENDPLRREKKGALEKFRDYVRDQAQAVQNTIHFNKFIPISKQIIDESNKPRGLTKAEAITRYKDFLDHVKSQLDYLG